MQRPIIIPSESAKKEEKKALSDNMMPEYDYLVKVKLLGDSGTGKTSLLLRYVDDTYTESYISTIGIDFKIKTLNIEGNIIKTQVWDTTGQERFRALKSNYERGTYFYIIAFDLTDQVSFNNLKIHIEEAQNERSNPLIILVGTKSDLEHKRVVDHVTAKEYTERQNLAAYVETSAKTGENVETLFRVATELYVRSIHPNFGKKVAEGEKESTSTISFDEFKTKYLKKFEGEIFKNSKSGMK